MAFEKRREFMGIYAVKNSNPNGDPLRGNEPRMDDENGMVLVSDVRIKRTIRDQWDKEGEVIFVKAYDQGTAKSLKERYLEPDIGGASSDDREKAMEKMRKCIDVRLFGITFAPQKMEKAAFSWTGPVQISWGHSFHKVKPMLVQGTAAFTSGEGKKQRSLRTEWIVPYAIIGFYGVANQYASVTTGASDEDVDKLRRAWWLGTKNLITRSKFEHKPLLWLEIVYKEGYKGLVGDLTGYVKLLGKDGSPLSEEEALSLRDYKDVIVDLSDLAEVIESDYKDYIDGIIVVKDKYVNIKGIDNISQYVRFVEPSQIEG